MDEKRPKTLIDKLIYTVYTLLGGVALLASMAFMVCGLWKMFLGLMMLGGISAPDLPSSSQGLAYWIVRSVRIVLPVHSDPGHDSGTSHEAMDYALRGLELVFFAPLPFALIKVVSLRLFEIGTSLSIEFPKDPEGLEDKASASKPQLNNKGEKEIVSVKMTTLHLMAAIVATDLVNRATDSKLTWEIATCEIMIIGALVAFSMVLKTHFHAE